MGEFMKWYKAYANLKGHKKRYRLESKLGVDYGLHFIHLWFSYIAEYAVDGDVTGFTPLEIARACEWKGDPDLFFEALSFAGFIDKVKGGSSGFRLIAHDWFEENSRFIAENEKRKPLGNPRKTRIKPLVEEKTIEDKTQQAYSDYFYKAYEARYQTKPSPPQPAFMQLSKRIKSGLSLKEWEGRVDAYFKSSFPPQKDLLGLVTTHWDRHPPIVKYGTAKPQLAI